MAAHPDLAGALAPYLQRLVELHDVAAAFGHCGAAPPAAEEHSGDERRLGDFVLLEEIGRGGMGVVYEARQISLSRRVALKVLPFAAVLDSRQIARFKNEAQAAAQLHHPNIVPVFAVGAERGVHYYAMQFIDGQPLDRAIAELRAQAGENRGSQALPATVGYGSGMDTDSPEVPRRVAAPSFLSDKWARPREYFEHVVRLGIQAADALHAAHSLGVVHRDVKPSNLLVDASGKLWVTDFGLARCQTDVALTRTGDVVGTRQYMSPEQALGQAALVDQRTDIYSLGVTLYELLTLRPAFEAGDAVTLARRIDREERMRPSKLQPALPADLETVVLKAMARERDERYLTAQDLADDLRRVLAGKPTVARPPTLPDRLGRVIRRHRRVATVAAAIFVVARVTLAGGTLLIFREKTKAQQDFARAERYFRQAQDTVDRFGSQFAERLAQVPGAEPVRRELLAETLAYYQQFVDQAGDDPRLWADLALTHAKIGSLNDQMGLTTEAIAAHDKAVALLETLAGEHADQAAYRADLAVCLNNRALALGRAGRTDEAVQSLRRAITLQKQLAAEDPRTTRYEAELALSHSNLGTLQRETGAMQDAETSFRRAVQLGERLAARAPHDVSVARNLAAAYNNLAALDTTPNQTAAVELYQQAAQYQRAAARGHEGRWQYRRELATTLSNLGAAQVHAGQQEEAAKTYQAAIALQKELLRIMPLDRAFRRDLAVSYNNLGLLHTNLRQGPTAEVCFRNALGFQEQLAAEQPDDIGLQSALGGVHNNLGMVLEGAGRTEEAARSFASAIEHQRRAYDQAPTVDQYRMFLSKHYYNYGRVLRKLERGDDAARAALERKQLWPRDPERLLSVAEELALAARLNDSKFTTTDRCAELAVGALREAVAAGLKTDDLDRRTALAAIKDRADFHELVARARTRSNSMRKRSALKRRLHFESLDARVVLSAAAIGAPVIELVPLDLKPVRFDQAFGDAGHAAFEVGRDGFDFGDRPRDVWSGGESWRDEAGSTPLGYVENLTQAMVIPVVASISANGLLVLSFSPFGTWSVTTDSVAPPGVESLHASGVPKSPHDEPDGFRLANVYQAQAPLNGGNTVSGFSLDVGYSRPAGQEIASLGGWLVSAAKSSSDTSVGSDARLGAVWQSPSGAPRSGDTAPASPLTRKLERWDVPETNLEGGLVELLSPDATDRLTPKSQRSKSELGELEDDIAAMKRLFDRLWSDLHEGWNPADEVAEEETAGRGNTDDSVPPNSDSETRPDAEQLAEGGWIELRLDVAPTESPSAASADGPAWNVANATGGMEAGVALIQTFELAAPIEEAAPAQVNDAVPDSETAGGAEAEAAPRPSAATMTSLGLLAALPFSRRKVRRDDEPRLQTLRRCAPQG